MDCDNTLWGGIIGEDGINKIKIGKTHPGSDYLEFQQAIQNLYNRGILLAICSKNNEQDVLEVLEKHPGRFQGKENIMMILSHCHDSLKNRGKFFITTDTN